MPFIVPAGSAGGSVPWWPWSLTPRAARAAGGWYLGAAALNWMLARQRSLNAAKVGLFALVLVKTLQLIGALFCESAFDGPSLARTLYIVQGAIILGYSSLTWCWTLRAPHAATSKARG